MTGNQGSGAQGGSGCSRFRGAVPAATHPQSADRHAERGYVLRFYAS